DHLHVQPQRRLRRRSRRRRAEDRQGGAGGRVSMLARALLVCATALCAAKTCADERSTWFVDAFREACTSELPNFERTDAKAKAQNLPVSSDAGTPRTEQGYFNHVKTWMIDPTTELSAAEARGPAGEVLSCGLSGPDPLGDEVKEYVMKVFDLG